MAKRRYPHGGRCVAGVLLLITLLAMAAPAGAAVTISPTGGDDTALIADAISDAASDDHIVILSEGTYLAHDIVVPAAVTIRADTANGHGPADTVIDAGLAGRIFDAGNHALAIDNLTLQNGAANIGSHNGYGGAIYAGSGSVTVTSSTITNCRAGNGGYGGYGGAIYTSGGDVTVTSSTITNCRAGNGGIGGGHGGAIYTSGGDVTVTSSTITNCRAGDGDTYGGDGGAIWTGSGGSGTVRFCRLIDNYAPGYGDTLYSVNSLTATDNWWGSNDGPSSGDHGGGASAPTWLVLGITASPSAITTAETSAIRANLTYDNTGADRSGSGMVPNGIPVIFAAGDGTLSPARTATASGAAITTFLPSDPGTVSVYAIVDDQIVRTTLDVTGPSVSAGPTTAIAVDPVSASTVYAGIDGAGIYRTTNSGGSWSPATNQPSNLHIRALVIHPVTHSTLYTGTYGDGVFRSTDSGVNWETCANTGLANRNVLTLVSDSSGRLYAGTESGVYASTDGCDTWYAVNEGLP